MISKTRQITDALFPTILQDVRYCKLSKAP